ncbi:hypothetical protein PENTCL1PPCAC_7664, partial [Pristionchus entomophagus]
FSSISSPIPFSICTVNLISPVEMGAESSRNAIERPPPRRRVFTGWEQFRADPSSKIDDCDEIVVEYVAEHSKVTLARTLTNYHLLPYFLHETTLHLEDIRSTFVSRGKGTSAYETTMRLLIADCDRLVEENLEMYEELESEGDMES